MERWRINVFAAVQVGSDPLKTVIFSRITAVSPIDLHIGLTASGFEEEKDAERR